MQLSRNAVGRAVRWRWDQDFVDLVMALVLTVFVFAVAIDHRVSLNPASAMLLAGQTLPLAIRRRAPEVVCAVCGFSIGFYSAFGYAEVGGNVGVLIAFYTIAANRPRTTAAIAAAFCGGGVFLTVLNYVALDVQGLTTLLNVYLEYALAWMLGDYLRVRRAYTHELEERARRLEREREERASQAVFDERARIARELHDVVAHHVSVMVVQAAAARRIAEKDPVAAADALAAVEGAGRTALAEMRQMLQVLRAEEPGTGPQPTLAELGRLVDQVREAGLPVELEIGGASRELPAGVDLAAFRIVQEALTNTVKHGGARAAAKVTLQFGERDLEIEVVDDGRGAAAPLISGEVGGHGLIGMRERVELYGGVMEAGPVFPGGFRVHVRLPIGRVQTATERPSARPGQGSALERMADEIGDASGVPSRGTVYPWPEYP